MLTFRLLTVGCAVGVVVLLIGVTAAYLKIPLAAEIIVAALAAIALLIRAIAQKLNPRGSPTGSGDRTGRSGAR